jgi:hypothetical protein
MLSTESLRLKHGSTMNVTVLMVPPTARSHANARQSAPVGECTAILPALHEPALEATC